MSHQISKPKFAYTALEPYFDTATMEIHTEKHHQTYADKLNAALENYLELQIKPLEELVGVLPEMNSADSTIIHNTAGGVLNHNLLWSFLSPKVDQPIPQPLHDSLIKSYKNVDAFKTAFTTKAMSLFGSGWTWLVKNGNEFEIVNLPNQDNPLSQNKLPLLALDLWEHAYYLKYQNRRPEYIEAFWHIINWEYINQLYQHSYD
jgi:superoxide dismutase, Fe-Mn family